jgi:hypothetical protein
MKLSTSITTAILLTFTNASFAGEIAKGKVEEVLNIVGSEKQFGINMSSGATGPCAGQWIYFKESNPSQNIDNYKFAFSLATTALVADKRIRIHNYSSDTCDGATFIGLYKN